MTQLFVSFVLDILVASLLCVSIAYCWRLNGRIRVLQDSKGELAQLIRQFDESTERASQSIQELQVTGRKITDSISVKIDKANFIADDLSFMIDKGAKIADQMESALSHARKGDAKPAFEQPRVNAPVNKSPQMMNPLLQKANIPLPQKPAAQPNATVQQKMSGLSSQSKAAASLESVLDRMSSRGNDSGTTSMSEAPRKQPIAGASVRMRSKAEQELFDAIKTTRQ